MLEFDLETESSGAHVFSFFQNVQVNLVRKMFKNRQ